jgi:predicted Rossmann fold flavoprotein
MNTEVCIIGAGPAGLMAAIGAATERAATLVVEGNANAGHKLLVTGGGRCNFTHAASVGELVRAFGKTGRFLRHSFHAFKPEEVQAFFAARGVRATVEPDGCVFPAVDRATAIRDVLIREAETHGVHCVYGRPVTQVAVVADGFEIRTKRHTISAQRVIIATGGVSWPQTGSTGDGYRLAKKLGHDLIAAKPSLVPLVTRDKWPGDVAGVCIANAALRATVAKHKVMARGSLVFAYDGIGGPAPQDMSRFLTDALAAGPSPIEIRLDLAPALDEATLDRQLQDQLAGHAKKRMPNILAEYVPKRLAATLCRLARCDGDLEANQITKDIRKRLAGLLKSLPLCITGTRPIAEATVTRGGVSLKQIEPRTMASKVCPGLYFAGEVVDADGPCGGYNLQMCFATGILAGRSAADSVVNPR